MSVSQTGFTRQTYERTVYAVVGVGIFGLLAGLLLDQQVAGTAVYLVGCWVGGAIAVLAPKFTDATLQDERDNDLHNHASGLTMRIAMLVGISVIPALYVLDAGGYVELTATVWGGVWVASALFLLYGVCFGVVQRRR
ncbi:DUF2178 domain-containing protein [Salarchaeum japonicum]|uniref:DUF2178 domain-containing protein n=1 Tax=Salarchaeum japonicum TaxID=555573 RepID=A0AAV3T2K0_9EURY|nr:DUF2178 domain-containing protein [Salarchaeum japonicum]